MLSLVHILSRKGATLPLMTVLLTGRIACRADVAPISVYRETVTLSQAGEGILHLTARAPGCDWGKKGAESAVVTISLDGEPNQEVVLWNGDAPHTYDLLLGPLAAGKHTLAVAFRPDLSPAGAHTAVVDRAPVAVVPATDPRYAVLAHVPLLYGRTDNASSDPPLIAYYEERRQPDGGRRLIYSMIWSNEDGGTGMAVGSLISRWGRSTDIEWIYDATLGPDGKTVSAVIQGDGHHTRPFAGAYRGEHPILRTSTTNNMVSDAGTSAMLFALAPLRAVDPSREPREALMDSAPWSYRVTAKEMAREGKYESIPDPLTETASDIRNYLHIDYNAHIEKEAKIAVQVRLKGGRTFVSDHGQDRDAIARSGWVRTAVELPAGTTARDIDQITVLRRDADPDASAHIRAVRAFFLDRNYRPLAPSVNWTGDLIVSTGRPSPILTTPQEVTDYGSH